jgi:3-deoxy-D-manno-octulosonate 8-phosphate phosphatase (KDO 8-P phosphatase)
MKDNDAIKTIKMLVLDVDGILSDGRIIYNSQGVESKNFNVLDGLGITLAKEAGLIIVVLSARESACTTVRCKELGIEEVYQGVQDKFSFLKKLLQKYRLSFSEVAYMGDDLQDLKAMSKVGLKITVPNAVNEIKESADYITNRSGGSGAVREAIEFILKGQAKWEKVLKDYFSLVE